MPAASCVDPSCRGGRAGNGGGRRGNGGGSGPLPAARRFVTRDTVEASLGAGASLLVPDRDNALCKRVLMRLRNPPIVRSSLVLLNRICWKQGVATTGPDGARCAPFEDQLWKSRSLIHDAMISSCRFASGCRCEMLAGCTNASCQALAVVNIGKTGRNCRTDVMPARRDQAGAGAGVRSDGLTAACRPFS